VRLIIRQLTVGCQHNLFVDFCTIHGVYVLFASKFVSFSAPVAVNRRFSRSAAIFKGAISNLQNYPEMRFA
jgi:hypothetical protein